MSSFSLPRVLPAALWWASGRAALGTIGAGVLVVLTLMTWSGTWWDGALLLLALAAWVWGVRSWLHLHRLALPWSESAKQQSQAVLASLSPIGLALLCLVVGTVLGTSHAMPEQELRGWAVVRGAILVISGLGTFLILIVILSTPPADAAEEEFLSMRPTMVAPQGIQSSASPPSGRFVGLLLLSGWLAATAGALGGSALLPLMQKDPSTLLGWWNTRATLDVQFRQTLMTPQSYWERLGALDRWRVLLSAKPFAQILLPPSVWPTRAESCALLRARASTLKPIAAVPGCVGGLALRADPIISFSTLTGGHDPGRAAETVSGVPVEKMARSLSK